MDEPKTSIPLTSWPEFFTAYDAAHQDPVNRFIHHATHLGAGAGVLMLGAHPLFGAALLLGAFPANWAGHAIFEGNTPAFHEPPDAWGKAQVALGGLAWTATTLASDVWKLVAKA
jgi:hypothetical protein